MTAQPLFCFVVPCFNEEGNVGPTVNSIRNALDAGATYEIILVDDCSTDGTLHEMEETAKLDPHIRVLHNPVNRSLGGSYKRGVSIAEAQHVMMVPGDDGFPSDSIAEILRHRAAADIVIPIVTNPGVRAWHRAAISRGFTTLMNWMFWLDVGYYNGAVLHRTKLLRSIDIKTDSFAYQAEALVKLIARGATYTHCNVRIQERAAGRSSATSLKNQIAVCKTVAHLVARVGLFRMVPLRRNKD